MYQHLHNRDAIRLEALLELTRIQVLKLTITHKLHLVSDAGLGASDDGRWKRGREDKARSIRADHVDKVGGASNVASHGPVSFAERASDNVNAVHHSALDWVGVLASALVGFKVEMFGDTGTTGSIHADSVHLIWKVNHVKV